ncbi:hypothetical protein [Synechococcus phage S-B68]|nr:hypothetical protein [Synechococcus phage S-B68]
MADMINPHHYRGDRKFEPIAVIEDWDLNYNLGNALKYISRNGRKPGEDPTEGLRKAIWYLEREIGKYERTAEDELEEATLEQCVRAINEAATQVVDLWDPTLGPTS